MAGLETGPVLRAGHLQVALKRVLRVYRLPPCLPECGIACQRCPIFLCRHPAAAPQALQAGVHTPRPSPSAAQPQAPGDSAGRVARGQPVRGDRLHDASREIAAPRAGCSGRIRKGQNCRAGQGGLGAGQAAREALGTPCEAHQRDGPSAHRRSVRSGRSAGNRRVADRAVPRPDRRRTRLATRGAVPDNPLGSGPTFAPISLVFV